MGGHAKRAGLAASPFALDERGSQVAYDTGVPSSTQMVSG